MTEQKNQLNNKIVNKIDQSIHQSVLCVLQEALYITEKASYMYRLDGRAQLAQ